MLKKQKIFMFLALMLFHVANVSGYSGGQCSTGTDCARDSSGACRDRDNSCGADNRPDTDRSSYRGGQCSVGVSCSQNASNACSDKQENCSSDNRRDPDCISHAIGGQCSAKNMSCPEDNPNCNRVDDDCDHICIPTERVSYPKNGILSRLWGQEARGQRVPRWEDFLSPDVQRYCTIGQEGNAHYCFAPHTRVWTPQGLVPLSQLNAGDTVYSFDLELHEITQSQVSVVLNRCVDKHLCVEIAGHRLQTTEDHPFYLDNGELVPAIDLSSGMSVLGAHDLSYSIDAVTPVPDELDVINLSLDSYHNFFVSLDDDTEYVPNQTALILVHNCEVDLNLEAELVSVDPLIVSPARLFRKIFAKAPPAQASGAVNIALIDKLKHQLRLESAHSPFTPQGYLKPEVIKEAEIAIAADKIKNTAIPKGYAKYKTQNFMSPVGEFQVHFYKCQTTGRVYYGHDYKAKVVWNKMSRKSK